MSRDPLHIDVLPSMLIGTRAADGDLLVTREVVEEAPLAVEGDIPFTNGVLPTFGTWPLISLAAELMQRLSVTVARNNNTKERRVAGPVNTINIGLR